MTTELNGGQTECKVGETVIKVGESIDYKSATDFRTSIGRIEKFRYAPGQEDIELKYRSVWMLIADMGKESVTEWISVRLWKEQTDKGLFTTKKLVINASPKPDVSPEYPF